MCIHIDPGVSRRIALNTFESICRIVRIRRLLGAAEGSAGTGPAAIPDGNLIPDADIFVASRLYRRGRRGLRSRPTT